MNQAEANKILKRAKTFNKMWFPLVLIFVIIGVLIALKQFNAQLFRTFSILETVVYGLLIIGFFYSLVMIVQAFRQPSDKKYYEAKNYGKQVEAKPESHNKVEQSYNKTPKPIENNSQQKQQQNIYIGKSGNIKYTKQYDTDNTLLIKPTSRVKIKK